MIRRRQAAVSDIWFEDFVPVLEYFAGNQNNTQTGGKLKTRKEYLTLLQKSAQMNYSSGWLVCTSPWIADYSTLNKASYDTSAQKMIIDENATNYEQEFTDMYNYAVDWTLSRAAWLSEQFK